MDKKQSIPKIFIILLLILFFSNLFQHNISVKAENTGETVEEVGKYTKRMLKSFSADYYYEMHKNYLDNPTSYSSVYGVYQSRLENILLFFGDAPLKDISTYEAYFAVDEKQTVQITIKSNKDYKQPLCLDITRLKFKDSSEYSSYSYDNYKLSSEDFSFKKGDEVKITLTLKKGVYTIELLKSPLCDSFFRDVRMNLKSISIATVNESVKGVKTETNKFYVEYGKRLKVGESTNLKITGAISKSDIKKITWSSSNSAIATVDKNGKITAKKAGECKITSKFPDGTEKTSIIIVPTQYDLKSYNIINDFMDSDYTENKFTEKSFNGFAYKIISLDAYERFHSKYLLADIVIYYPDKTKRDSLEIYYDDMFYYGDDDLYTKFPKGENMK